MELTKEYFDKAVKKLANKSQLAGMEKRIVGTLSARIKESQEELACITNNGFDDVLDRLDVRERVHKLEIDMSKMKTALHLT